MRLNKQFVRNSSEGTECSCGSLLNKIPKLAIVFFLFSLFPFLFFSCSSAPAPTGDVSTIRNITENMLEQINTAANRGRYNDAMLMLYEARRLALGTDDPVLRIRTSTKRGNVLFSMGRHEEAFSEWESAVLEAEASGENNLAAFARICIIRASLVLLDDGEGAVAVSPAVGGSAEELRSRLEREMAIVRSDQHLSAAAYVTMGLAEKQLGRWADAEAAVRMAMAIYERNLLLEDIAYCWFVIGSIRSRAGNFDAALEALRLAISFDRRVENGYGLASSWQAMGDVYQRAGRHAESLAAYRRAAEIFRAIGLDERAEMLK